VRRRLRSPHDRWATLLSVLPVAVAVPLLFAGAGSSLPATGSTPASIVAIYQRDCAVCHGSTGKGTSLGPRIAGRGTALVDYMLSTGRMPLPSPHAPLDRRTPAYDAATREELVRYIAGFAPGGPAIPKLDLAHADLGEGGQLYQLNCAPCHSAGGEGGALLNTAAPPLRDATPEQTAEAIRSGPPPMPRFGQAALSDAQVSSVVAYVQYLRHPDNRGGIPLWNLGPLTEGAVALVFGLGLLVSVAWLIERRGLR